MTGRTEDTSAMSAECALAQRPGCSDWHKRCSQTRNIPLPRSRGILLIRRCTCPHHRYTSPG
ncbi:hypothetical protein ACWDGI_30450 [Streptomyces sp. NPDC001220]